MYTEKRMGLLEGIRVLDLGMAGLGPICGQMLGDLGADIIKVEPLEGDFARISPIGGDSNLFICLNRNKRSININLKEPAGKDVVLKLADKADVLIENFRPGVMKNLGLDFELVSKTNPRLVYVSLSMYGENGPMAKRRGADIWAQAFSGMVASMGDPGKNPRLIGYAFLDTMGAVLGATGAVSALFQRERTGKGVRVTTSLLNAASLMQQTELSFYLIDKINLVKGGRGNPQGYFPYGAYTAKDGDIVTIFGQDDGEWIIFCNLLGIEHLLEDERYNTVAKRRERRSELYPVLDEAFSKKTREEWAEAFRQQGLRCDPALDYAEFCEHPQFQANQDVLEIDHPVYGKIKSVGAPIKFNGVVTRTSNTAAPLVGQHSKQILGELGYEEREIERLIERGIVGIMPPDMLRPISRKGVVPSGSVRGVGYEKKKKVNN